MRKSLLTISVLLVSLLTFSQAQAVATYKWLDKEGSVHYTQHPPAEGVAYEKIQTIRPSSTNNNSSSVKSPTAARDSILADKDKREKNDLIAKETAKNEETRKNNCELAKKRLNSFQVNRRWKDKDGNINVMTEEERKAKIEESKQHIKEYCD